MVPCPECTPPVWISTAISVMPTIPFCSSFDPGPVQMAPWPGATKNWQRFWRNKGWNQTGPVRHPPNCTSALPAKGLMHKASTRGNVHHWHLDANGTWELTWTNSSSPHQLPYSQTLSCDPSLPRQLSWQNSLYCVRKVWKQSSKKLYAESLLENLLINFSNYWKSLGPGKGTQRTGWGGGELGAFGYAQKKRSKVGDPRILGALWGTVGTSQVGCSHGEKFTYTCKKKAYHGSLEFQCFLVSIFFSVMEWVIYMLLCHKKIINFGSIMNLS